MTEEETNELTPEEEKSLDADEIDKAHQKVKEQLSKTKDRLEGKPANDLETFREHRKNLADTAKELAALIRKQDKDEPAVKELGELSCQLGDHRFLVGAFGTTAAGKSTLVNALVGGKEDLLTEGMGRTTLVVTRIEKPDKEHPDGTSVLRYKTIKEVVKQLEEHLGNLGIDREEIPKKIGRLGDPAFHSWLKGQIEDATSNKKEGDANDPESSKTEAGNSLNHFLKGWGECEQFLGDSRPFPAGKREQTDALIHEPNYEHACYVKERILYHANRLTGDHGIELVDAPGVSADDADTQRAVSMARKADAFVFVSSVGFQFMQADRRFLEDLDDSLHGDRKKKLIFVLNKTQTIDPYQCVPPVETSEEAIKAQEDRFRDTLAEHGFKDVHVLSVDAQCGKYARRWALPGGGSDEVLNRRFDHAKFTGRPGTEENLKLSGIDDFESDLVNILLDLKYNHDVSEQVHKIEKIEADYKAQLKKSIEDHEAGVDKIQEELEQHRKSRKIAKMALEGYQGKWKKRTDAIHADKEKQCNDILNDFFEKVVDEIMNGLNKGVSTKTVVKRKIKGKIPWLVTKVKQARQFYEKEYRKIRDKTFKEDLTLILEEYGDDELPEINIDHQEEGERESIRHCAQSMIHVTSGEITWANVGGGFWDLVTFDLKEQKSFKGIIWECLEKRRGRFIERMHEVMTGWIDCDWHNFEEQTTNQFEHLMDNIGSRIKNRINAKKRSKGKGDRSKKALERFHQASGEILEQLKEVRKAAEKRRPFEGAGA